jgi:cell division transport system ATP-binding protein
MFGREIATTPREELPALRRRIGVVFQEFRLLDHLTVFENVSLPRRVMGEFESQYRAEVEELLSWVGLGNRLNAKPATLSGGEKQRVAIARAVVAKPELLLADEPTGNVDPEIGGRIMRLFMELNKLGTSVMIATHDLRIMERLPASRIFKLAEGRMTVAKSAEFIAEAKRA